MYSKILHRSSVLVYTNSRADLDLKYVYAKLADSDRYQLCPIDPLPPATSDDETIVATNTSLGVAPLVKADNLISTSNITSHSPCLIIRF